MQRSPIRRLDEALRCTEAMLRALETLHRVQCFSNAPLETRLPLVGILGSYREFRTHLLSIRTFEEFDSKKFGIEYPYLDDELGKTLEAFALFLGKIAAWVTQSKRIWHLNEDLQLLLMGSSFGDRTCGDIPWPLETFGIALDVPIKCKRSNDFKISESDFFLVSRPNRISKGNLDPAKVRQNLVSVFFNKDLGGWQAPDALFEQYERFLSGKSRRAPEPEKLLKATMLPGRSSPFGLIGAVELALPLNNVRIDHALTLIAKESREAALAWRIVIGLCFYLETLAENSPYRGAARKTARKPHTLDLSAVTQEAEVCSVLSSRVLTPVQRRELREVCIEGRGGWELPVHWRIAHMRRPPGKGHDPNEPKTVPIPFTMVNRARLGDNANPRGSEVHL